MKRITRVLALGLLAFGTMSSPVFAMTAPAAPTAPAQTPAPQAPAAPAPAIPKDTRNGITRPKAGTGTGKVWTIADELSAKEGKPATRKAVIEEAMKQELNAATAATQYGRWRKYYGLGAEPKEAATAPATAPATTPANPDVSTEPAPAAG